jgi:hypothetical protein
MAKPLADEILACNTSIEQMKNRPTVGVDTVDPIQEDAGSKVGMVPSAVFTEHMDKPLSQADCSGGSSSTPLILTATTTPNGATRVQIGKTVSTFCVANAPNPTYANQPTPLYILPASGRWSHSLPR